jgi:hypothetical protein
MLLIGFNCHNCHCLQLRLDAKVPGTVLLRDQNGVVYFITFNNIQQVSQATVWMLPLLLPFLLKKLCWHEGKDQRGMINQCGCIRCSTNMSIFEQ